MILETESCVENARKCCMQQVNTQLLDNLTEHWPIIVEQNKTRFARIMEKTNLWELSKELTREFGKGFSRSNSAKYAGILSCL